RVGMRPNIFSRDIEHDAAKCLIAAGRHNALLRLVAAGRLLAGIEARSHYDTLRAEHDGCRKRTPICGTTGENNRGLSADRIDDGGDARQRALRYAGPARFAALRHDNVGALRDYLSRHRHALNLTYDQGTGSFHPVDEGCGIAEGEPKGARFDGERHVEKLGL